MAFFLSVRLRPLSYCKLAMLVFVCYCLAASSWRNFMEYSTMAAKSFQLENMEVQWVRKALDTQRAALVRSKAKELSGSEIEALRSKEIAALESLINKFS